MTIEVRPKLVLAKGQIIQTYFDRCLLFSKDDKKVEVVYSNDHYFINGGHKRFTREQVVDKLNNVFNRTSKDYKCLDWFLMHTSPFAQFHDNFSKEIK